MINWRARLRAMAVHFLATAVVAVAAAWVVFGLWYPSPFAEMLGGTRLFMMILLCDIVLGPVLSLVVFDTRKPRKELLLDYTVIALLQLAALTYGLHTVAEARPVFVVAMKDRLEIVRSGELSDQNLRQAEQLAWRKRSWSGPGFVSVQVPEDPAERQALLFSALEGRDIHLLPKYYRAYHEAGLEEASSIDSLRPKSAAHAELADQATANHGDGLRWLPVYYQGGHGIAVIDTKGEVVAWSRLDPDGG